MVDFLKERNEASTIPILLGGDFNSLWGKWQSDPFDQVCTAPGLSAASRRSNCVDRSSVKPQTIMLAMYELHWDWGSCGGACTGATRGVPGEWCVRATDNGDCHQQPP